MSTVLFVSTTVPDRGLVKEHRYSAYLSAEQKAEIIEQLKEKVPNIDNYIISMKVEISLKLYDTKNSRV